MEARHEGMAKAVPAVNGDGRRDGARTVSSSGARLLVCAGMGLLLGWMMSLLLRGGVLSGPYAGQRSLSFDGFFVAATASVAFCMAAFCLPLRFLGRTLDRPAARVVAGLLALIGAACTALLGLVAFQDTLLVALLGVVCGVAMASLLMLWMLVLAGLDPRDTVIVVLADIVIALAAFLAIHFTGKVLGSPLTTTAVSLLLLAGSFALLVKEWGLLAEPHGIVQEPTPTLVKLALFAFVTTAVVEYASRFMVVEAQEFFFQGNHDRFLLQVVGLLVCAAVATGLALALRVLDRRTGAVVVALYRIIVFVVMSGLVMALLPYATLFVATDTIILLARFLVLFGMWAIGLHVVFLQGSDVAGALSFMLVAQFLGLLVGAVVGEQIPLAMGDSPWPRSGLALCAVLLVLVTLFVFTDLDASAVERVGLRDAGGAAGLSLDERVARVRERFGLTEREAEVLGLLAVGRNAVSIQEALTVSYNTVKVHRRNIYLKMDVHSQQELLDVMESIE